MEKCLTLLEFAISAEPPEQKTKVYSVYDPLKDLADRLEAKCESEGYAVPVSAATTASTSSGADQSEDSRVRYSMLLTEIFNKVCDEIEKAAAASGDLPPLSAKQLSVITSALQFFIPTALLPYMDEGVGTEAESRSVIVKQWKLFQGDEIFKTAKLVSATRTLFRLAKSCPDVMAIVVSRFFGDFICANEQVIHLGVTSLKEAYNQVLSSDVSREELISELFSLLHRNASSKRRVAVPDWFQAALGRRLSEIVIEPNGIYHLTSALTEDGGVMFDNFAFVQQLARVLSRRPQFLQADVTRWRLYYGNILKQLLHVMRKHPMAERVAVWLSVTVTGIAEVVPRAVDICFFDSLLHPWEILRDRSSVIHLGGRGWTQRLDASLRTLALFIKGLPPSAALLNFSRFQKLFPLWLVLVGSAMISETDADIEMRKLCGFVKDLDMILRRILNDSALGSDEQKAEFLLDQLSTTCFQDYGTIVAEVAPRPKVVEVMEVEGGECTSDYVMRYENVCLRLQEIEENEIAWLDRVATGTVLLLQNMDKARSQPLLLRLLSQCVKKWRQDEGAAGEPNLEVDRFVASLSEAASWSKGSFKMRVQYLMGYFGELLADLDMESEEVLLCVMEVAKAILESANEKLMNIVHESFDVSFGKTEEEELSNVERKSIEMAVALIGGSLLKASTSPMLMKSLSSAAAALEGFCSLITKLGSAKRSEYSVISASVQQLLDILKTVGVQADSSCAVRESTALSEAKKRCNGGRDKLDEIFLDLDDSLEPVKGHALVMLARYVRKRDKSVLSRIEQDRVEIMKKVMKQLINADSYVYLAAIGAMAELAYWNRTCFDMVVEFFVDPLAFFREIIDKENDMKLEEDEKKNFIVIQRIKLGEALAKVCRSLGDMAAWHFERLVNPFLLMIKTTRDGQLKASCLCAMADLIVACRGRGFDSVINEMLSMIEQLLIGGREAILRRASMTLLRGILVSYDSELLTGLSSQLRDIHRHLRQLLLADEDEGVRLLAELCLIDMKEQLNRAINEASASAFRKIRIS